MQNRSQPRAEMSADARKRLMDMQRLADERMQEFLVDLHAEFFSEEELTAELEFYESDIGQRIALQRRRMMEEFPKRLHSAFADLNEPGTRGPIGFHSGKLRPTDDSYRNDRMD